MKIYLSEFDDPAMNLAIEEYLFREYQQEIIMLYINRQSIIVGKHQNLYAEVNFSFCYKNRIPVFRRISGGGTVYHDNGNLNFSFILNRDKSGKNLKQYLITLQKFFKDKLNLTVKISERNDLWLRSKKISGNAEHLLKNRLLHHGTLLYNANLDRLQKTLHKSRGHYTCKSVASVRSRTTNICDHLEDSLTFTKFKELLSSYIEAYYETQKLNLTENEINEINAIAKNKYRSRDWNFNYPTNYSFEKTTQINANHYDIELKVDKGVITESNIYINDAPVSGISLKDVEHYPTNLFDALNTTDLWKDIQNYYLEIFF